ncbi:peptidase S9 prolyl oligopeptidase active site domain protein [Haladaptatus paucihalophilus DX253]|uniref:Acyl-peptide hydrolase n=1 Tax=Haladaptatus paucihalophilus DX253 TaxID=797209 RepID=E7QV35_HALPU|nr:S9 family peptidase [Haladaptatus paucihalophilus]EFW91553.1 peptidase S9 prolyl oligopeptidase active site domain protein [Haladaptatus paucihalophilus DX253]SHL24846.1 Dipeptidyl aminopeptidase/acylaminoacyl peptidase [Haladaptatus paucihalophilus DX253]
MSDARYPLTRYLGIDSAGSPTMTIDGSLVFLADTTGTPQVWSLDEPGAFPSRLTAHDERVSFVSASPTRSEVVFGMDTGSDEHDQLYRYDLDSGTETALTATPEAIHLWGAWSPDGDRIAFTANRREGSTFDVYVQGRDDAEATLVHEGPGGFLSVEAWGEPGIVCSKANASFDQNLFLLDPESGDYRKLTDDTDARYHDVTFGPDDDLYCVTNHGADTAYVARLDLDDGAPTVVEEAGDWNVSHLLLHGGTGRVVWVRNVDGYSEVHAGRLTAGDDIEPLSTPDLPDGVVFAAGFGPDGDCAISMSRSDDPKNVFVLNPDTGSAERWTNFGTLGIPRETFLDPEIVRYESFDGREIPAYWTLPPNAEPGETPVIVDIHGGPEHQRQPWFYPTKQYFLQHGYAVLEPNVRGSSGYGTAYTHLDDTDKRMDSVADIEAAVGWLHERDAVDADRIVAYGRSYGGFMVLAAITEYPDLWAAAVDFVGIADFETFLENTGEWRRSHREQEYGSLENRDLLRSISPIHEAERISCPLFIQHGANDPRVPVGEAKQIAERVRERGVPVETCIFEDEGHHTTSRENLIDEFERIAAFLDEHV